MGQSFKQKLAEELAKSGGQPHLSFILGDPVGEYNYPEIKATGCQSPEVRVIWDSTQMGDSLKAIGITDPAEEQEKLLQTLKYQIAKYTNDVNNGLMVDEDPDTSYDRYIQVTIWFDFYSTPEQAQKAFLGYLDMLSQICLEQIINAGGDDDFFDYVPCFVDFYRQICEIMHLPEHYNQFVSQIPRDDPDFIDEAIYVKNL